LQERIPSGHTAPRRRSFGSCASGRTRRLVVATRIAGSRVLVAGASLVTKSFDRLLAAETGIEVENVSPLRVTLPWERYRRKNLSNRCADSVRGITPFASRAFPA
jgi:hypothetical protein